MVCPTKFEKESKRVGPLCIMRREEQSWGMPLPLRLPLLLSVQTPVRVVYKFYSRFPSDLDSPCVWLIPRYYPMPIPCVLVCWDAMYNSVGGFRVVGSLHSIAAVVSISRRCLPHRLISRRTGGIFC